MAEVPLLSPALGVEVSLSVIVGGRGSVPSCLRARFSSTVS